MQSYKYITVNIAYDYRIKIIIREYEIFTEYKIHMIVCLEPGRGIDRHAYRDTVAAAYSLQILRPRLGHTDSGHCLVQ